MLYLLRAGATSGGLWRLASAHLPPVHLPLSTLLTVDSIHYISYFYVLKNYKIIFFACIATRIVKKFSNIELFLFSTTVFHVFYNK